MFAIHQNQNHMKAIYRFLVTLLPFISSAQGFIGMYEYVNSDKLTYDYEKQYFSQTGSYDYQVQDDFDDKISLDAFNLVWEEMHRVIDENGLHIVSSGVIAGGSKMSTDYNGVLSDLNKGTKYIAIRYELNNGYFIYINLQDSFCGLSITEERVE